MSLLPAIFTLTNEENFELWHTKVCVITCWWQASILWSFSLFGITFWCNFGNHKHWRQLFARRNCIITFAKKFVIHEITNIICSQLFDARHGIDLSVLNIQRVDAMSGVKTVARIQYRLYHLHSFDGLPFSFQRNNGGNPGKEVQSLGEIPTHDIMVRVGHTCFSTQDMASKNDARYGIGLLQLL